jgi:hypothetical protein
MVINISALRKGRVREWRNIIDKFWRIPGTNWPNFYFIYQERKDFSAKSVEDDVISDYKFRLISRIKRENKERYDRLDNLIPFGGVEITSQVVEYLFKLYKFSKRKQKAVREAVETYLGGRR